MILQQQAASAAAAASKTTREVYVGNLAVGLVTDEILKTLFNNALVATFPQNALPGQEPVINVNMHSDGRYAFVELRSPEMATEALKIGGLQLLGQAISVGRPSGYVDPTLVQQQAQAAMLALQQFQAGGAAAGAVPTLPGLPGAVPGAVAAPALNPLPTAPTTVAGLVPPGPPPMPGDGEEPFLTLPAMPTRACPGLPDSAQRLLLLLLPVALVPQCDALEAKHCNAVADAVPLSQSVSYKTCWEPFPTPGWPRPSFTPFPVRSTETTFVG